MMTATDFHNENETTMLSRLLTTLEVADLLGVSTRTVFTLTKKGELPSVRVGHSVRYDERDLTRWIDSRKTG